MVIREDEGWRAVLREYRWPLLALLLAVGLIGCVAGLVLALRSHDSAALTIQPYRAPLAAVPTNHVTASGTAVVELQGTTATVALNTTGLLGGSPHLAHIHGEGKGICPTASSARLHNGHLSISTGDALALYGPPLASLTEWGSTNGSSPTNIDLNRYPANADIHYRRTFTVSRLVADLIRDGDAVVVVHGIDYNYNHVYDFAALGVSDLDGTLPGEATAPALCGPLRPSPGTLSASARDTARPTGATYVASLEPRLVTEHRGTPPLLSFPVR